MALGLLNFVKGGCIAERACSKPPAGQAYSCSRDLMFCAVVLGRGGRNWLDGGESGAGERGK